MLSITSGAATTITYNSYVRDPSGNKMAVSNSTAAGATFLATLNVVDGLFIMQKN